jgi:myo-inositol-1-phosphate synthase
MIMLNSAQAGRKVRIAIIGVGNCASSLVQGLTFYGDRGSNAQVAGLMTPDIGGYMPGDVEIAAAFDVSADKVGQDVSEAIWARPNNTCRFAIPEPTGCFVERGPTLDGIGRYMRDEITESDRAPCNVAQALIESRTDVVVSYLPVGAERASHFYAEQAIEAGCAYVNCIPVFLASNTAWRQRFEDARLPIIGDDIKSQVGATIVHRMLANLFEQRGVKVERSYQLNFGGNADFRNMLERERLHAKKISKTASVQSQLGEPMPAEHLHIGPSDFVPWLQDRKNAFIRLEGTGFGGVPLNLELKLEVWDSPNSAGVVIDAVRCAKLALDRGMSGALVAPSSYLMKSPPRQFTDHEAHLEMCSFVAGTPTA